MKKYFFDLATPKECFYDYQGQALVEHEAHQVAHLVALDLASTGTCDWAGAAVQVRDVFGKTLFSVGIQEFDLVAA
jgi:hypothetical protein